MCEKCKENENERFVHEKELLDTIFSRKVDAGYQIAWLQKAKELAETDEYTREILKTVTDIIENKDYTRLYLIIMEYDRNVKFWANANVIPMPDFGLPFWCCPLD